MHVILKWWMCKAVTLVHLISVLSTLLRCLTESFLFSKQTTSEASAKRRRFTGNFDNVSYPKMWLEMGGSCIFHINCLAVCWFSSFSESKTWKCIPHLWHDSSTVVNHVPTKTGKKKLSNVKSELYISSIEFIWYKINLKPSSCFSYVTDDWLQSLTVIHFLCWICFWVSQHAAVGGVTDVSEECAAFVFRVEMRRQKHSVHLKCWQCGPLFTMCLHQRTGETLWVMIYKNMLFHTRTAFLWLIGNFP